VVVTSTLAAFAAQIGSSGPVAVVGGRTQWEVGGEVDPRARLVGAPSGVVAVHAAEMTVRVGAGTTIAALHAALAESGQTTALDGADGATVGGTLAVGHSGLRRLRLGPVRDTLLEARYVSAEGRVIVAGGPTVKNVTGYDLCRLLVGSLGTLGFLGEVLLRTRPLPDAAQWLAGPVAPQLVLDALYRPSCVLWDGTTSWTLVEGYEPDVESESAAGGRLGLRPVEGPPDLPPVRSSLRPDALASLPRSLAGRFVAQIGVGVVHADQPVAAPAPSDAVRTLHHRLQQEFDPTGRCNPGRDPLRTREAVAP
jgi:FAD/FMN-containing dehydrogenase